MMNDRKDIVGSTQHMDKKVLGVSSDRDKVTCMER
jgi:hypothetical protein